MRFFKSLLAASVAAAFLTACGGGGSGGGDEDSGPDTTAQAAGLYQGQSAGQTVAILVVDTGRFYSLYGEQVGDTFYISGLLVGRGSGEGDEFRSSRVRDFSFEFGEVTSPSITATIANKQSFNGTISEGNQSLEFTTSYLAEYETTPTLAAIEGTYVGFAADGRSAQSDNASLSVANGAITGSTAQGCNFTGTVAPRAAGNVYNLTIRFGSGCAENGATWSGHAYLSGGEITELYAMATTDSLGDAALFIGTKQ